MTIQARFPGRCSVCGCKIKVGEDVEWDKGSRTVRHPDNHPMCSHRAPAAARPASADRTILASVPGGAQAPAGRNRRPGDCERCGSYLATGAGLLVRCLADTGCPRHMDADGWHLYCADRKACDVLREENRNFAETARKAKIEAALATLRGLTEPIRLRYRDGEYLSGWEVELGAWSQRTLRSEHQATAEALATLGLCEHVSSWGYHVPQRVVDALGEEFTGAQAADYYGTPDAHQAR